MSAQGARAGTGQAAEATMQATPDRGHRTLSAEMVVAVATITVIGLLLRLPSFGDSLFGDEVSTYFIVSGRGLGHVLDVVRSDQEVTPPLYFVLAWATKGLLGDPGESLRLTSLLAGIAAIPLTYLLGSWTVGRRAALVGSALVALSPFLIYFSTEARAYSLLLLVVLLSTVCLVRALDTGRTLWWVAYAVFSCAAVYTHYTAVFVLAAQLGWALWTRPDARRALVVANAAAAAAYLPWLPGFVDDRSSPGNLIGFFHPFTLDAVETDLEQWFVGHQILPIATLPGRAAFAIAAAGVAVGLLSALLRLFRGQGWRPGSRTVLVVLLALAAPVGAALYSLVGDTIFLQNNLISSWPGLALALGVLLTSARGALRLAAIGLVFVGFVVGAIKMLNPDYQRPDYKGAARFIDRTGAPGDPVLEVPFAANPFTALEVALAHPGGSPAEAGHRVLRVGVPTLHTKRHSLAQGVPPSTPLPPPPDRALARRARNRAEGGDLFLVRPSFTLVGGDPAPVLNALAPRFRHVATRVFPGFNTVTVDVYRDTGGSSSQARSGRSRTGAGD